MDVAEMKISTLLVSLFVSLVVCYAAVDAVSVNINDHQDIAKNTISEDDRRGVPQSEVDSENNKNKNDKFRRNAASSSASEKQQRYLQPAASSYDIHHSTTGGGGSDTSGSAKPDYYPSASGLGSLTPLPYGHGAPPTDLKYHHHHLPPLHHGTGGGITGYGSSGGGIGHATGYGTGHGGDLGLGLGGHTYHYGGPAYGGGGGGGGKYPGYGLTKYGGDYGGHGGDYGGHGGLFGGGGHGGHSGHSHLKGLLLPLAGIALLGAAAALTTNPVLLQLGVVNGKRKRRSVHEAAYQSVKRDLDKYKSIGEHIRRNS